MKKLLRILAALSALAVIALLLLVSPALVGLGLEGEEMPSGSASKPASPASWRALARKDIEAARTILEANTPITFDTKNGSHHEWLEKGETVALAELDRVTDYPGYFYLLSRYINGFQDPHISLVPIDHDTTPDPLPMRWPGFVASSIGGQAIVSYRDETDPEAPPLGARLVKCDDQSLAELAEERIFPYTMNRILAGDQRRAITRLFLDRGNPFAAPPTSCVLEIDGQKGVFELRWRDVGDLRVEYLRAYEDAGAGAPAVFGATEVAPGVVWIGVPTFRSSPETAPKLEKLVQDLARRGDTLRAGRAIVIDTRGNGGGNSAWADRFAEAIFGRAVLAASATNHEESSVDWRASEGNARHWRTASDEYSDEFGVVSVERIHALYVAGQLHNYSGSNPPIWHEGGVAQSSGGGLTKRRPHGGKRPFPAQVYFLSNGSCGSSCLNFADRVLMVPEVQLIGAATSGDSPYGEVRLQQLPSGLVRIVLPQKIWRGMGRGPLEAYEPDMTYDGAWDDASVRAWVLGLIGPTPK